MTNIQFINIYIMYSQWTTQCRTWRGWGEAFRLLYSINVYNLANEICQSVLGEVGGESVGYRRRVFTVYKCILCLASELRHDVPGEVG